MNRALGNTLSEQLTDEGIGVGNCAASDDLKEGIRAFVEKRKPQFRDGDRRGLAVDQVGRAWRGKSANFFPAPARETRSGAGVQYCGPNSSPKRRIVDSTLSSPTLSARLGPRGAAESHIHCNTPTSMSIEPRADAFGDDPGASFTNGNKQPVD